MTRGRSRSAPPLCLCPAFLGIAAGPEFLYNHSKAPAAPRGKGREESMKEFSLTVDSMTKEEYLQAAHRYAARVYSLLAFFIVVICGIILIFMERITPGALLSPAVFFLLAVLFCETRFRMEYKKGMKEFPAVTYAFDAKGWSADPGTGPIRFDWAQTPRMKETRDCFFVYNDDTSSNLIPKRLLGKAQTEALRRWYANSRSAAAAREKQQRSRRKAEIREKKSRSPFSTQYRRH